MLIPVQGLVRRDGDEIPLRQVVKLAGLLRPRLRGALRHQLVGKVIRPAALDHVIEVLLRGSRLDVVRVRASRVITLMTPKVVA